MKYLHFVDLNGRHNCKFKFKVRVTWSKDPFKILELVKRDDNNR